MKYKIMDGNEACSLISYKFSELAGIYPITPASPMAEYVDKYSAGEQLNFYGEKVNITQMQSEAGAIALVHGALQNGIIATTYTASQGLLLMIPSMYKIAGEMLPCVINVAARSLATHSLSILGDHQDIYSVRQTGFAMFATSSVQQVMDLTAIPYLSSLKGRIPFVNFFDGFRTSHELQKIELINLEKIKKLIDKNALKKFRNRALSINNVTKGTNLNDDIYFQISEARNKYYDALPDIVNEYMEKISEISGRKYKPFDYYGAIDASKVIVAMGSVCETIRETVDYLNANDNKVGLIEVHLYRPFSSKYLLDVLPKTVKSIAVLDRTKEPGAMAPLYLDVKDVISNFNSKIKVVGGRYGLSSKNTTPYQIKAVYSYLEKKDNHEFTIGIVDDVTNLSLNEEYFDTDYNVHEMLIYGYGSDGMVSASKDIIKIIGNNTNAYTQGYFEYDSKKSGGLTKCHLRFSNSEIHSSYYVEKPSLIVCTKDDYLLKYSMLDKAKSKSVFIINTNKNMEELLNSISSHDKRIIKDKKIKVYTIDASGIAYKNGLGNKINLIIATAIFKISNIIPFDFAFKELKKSVSILLTNKGKELIDKNISCINDTLDNLNLLKLNIKDIKDVDSHSLNIFDLIDKKLGDTLKVSQVEEFVDGSFPGGKSIFEEKNIAELLPCYNPENCIMCGQCSFVCPHGVIRPFLLDDREFINAPTKLKDKLKDSLIKNHSLRFMIGVDYKNCTGCGLCSKVCPGKKGVKAITMKESDAVKTVENIENSKYLFNKVDEHIVFPINTVKGSQFVKPKFQFSGACAGCGQTAYLKLLTQLFGNELVIANATGCSSIYGGSVPKTPYSVPWMNSLFEDNAEFGMGLEVADRINKDKIKKIIYRNIDKVSEPEKDIYASYYKRCNYENSCLLYELVMNNKNRELLALKDFIKTKSFWIVGGDGWAYDIGYGGLDHVLSSGENVNILVLDTEVYSNTGGQTSKSSRIGSVAKFSSTGKKTNKKDLAKLAMSYPNVYVASISMGANMNQTVKAFIEAYNHKGPSIIIAYAPCIAHGISNGVIDSTDEQKRATQSGYFPIFRYNPDEEILLLDSDADFTKYFEFLLGEDRYKLLKKVNPNEYKSLLEQNKKESINRFKYLKSLCKKGKE
ncbi:MAG: pyruvate:ferredoxin (flavodoxin) oxidoreductase [bacterium]|nr:pyruvate:ferredoxin (flavodoxin) oxidoreductase [bacterium]